MGSLWMPVTQTLVSITACPHQWEGMCSVAPQLDVATLARNADVALATRGFVSGLHALRWRRSKRAERGFTGVGVRLASPGRCRQSVMTTRSQFEPTRELPIDISLTP
jgi:hypothetical protein